MPKAELEPCIPFPRSDMDMRRAVFVSGQDGDDQAIVEADFHKNLTVGLNGMIHGSPNKGMSSGTSFYQSVSGLPDSPDRQAGSLAASGFALGYGKTAPGWGRS